MLQPVENPYARYNAFQAAEYFAEWANARLLGQPVEVYFIMMCNLLEDILQGDPEVGDTNPDEAELVACRELFEVVCEADLPHTGEIETAPISDAELRKILKAAVVARDLLARPLPQEPYLTQIGKA